jgi:hypothetical protein
VRRRISTAKIVSVLVLGAVAALLLPAAAGAQSRTLGSPLALAPDWPYGCETKPTFTEQSLDGYYRPGPGTADCTWFQTGVYGAVDYNDPRTGSVPADGTITNVSVRSGPNPAPLRIVIVRMIGGVGSGGQQSTACCAFQSETPPLQPPPQSNQTNSWAVNIPVERNAKGTAVVADFVGISAVGPGSLPLAFTGDTNFHNQPPGAPEAGFLYPRLGALESPGGGTRNHEAIPNVEVMLQWTWVPKGVVPPPPPPPPGAAALPKAERAARVAAGRALIQLVCGADVACQGQLGLLTGSPGKVAAKQRSLGKTDYLVAAGKEETVTLKLNKRGKALVKKRKKTKVTLQMTPAGGTPVSSKLTLKRKAR